MRDLTLLAARVLLAAIFIMAGYGKLTGYEGTQAYMASQGVPGALLPLVILMELGGGLAIVAGFLTRFTAVSLAAFCIASAVLFHNNFADPMQGILFMKNLAIAGGFLVLSVFGPGDLSVDNWSSRPALD